MQCPFGIHSRGKHVIFMCLVPYNYRLWHMQSVMAYVHLTTPDSLAELRLWTTPPPV